MERDSGNRESRIRELAYQIWREEGEPDGGADRHWLAAEALYEAEDPERQRIEGEPPGDMAEKPGEAAQAPRRRKAGAR